MGNRFALSVMTNDRPGIVSAISGSVLELGGNILALSQTVVENIFTIILVTRFPDKITSSDVQRAVEAGGNPGEFSVVVRDYNEPAGPTLNPEYPQSRGEQYILTATGKDSMGMVYHLTSYLAEKGINILDIAVYMKREEVVLVAQLFLPWNINIPETQKDLRALGEERALSILLQHVNIFNQTNRV